MLKRIGYKEGKQGDHGVNENIQWIRSSKRKEIISSAF